MTPARHAAAMSEADVARITVWPHRVGGNFAAMEKRAGRAAAVVKADAYGLGLACVLPALMAAGCESFFVARLAEGIALRKLAPAVRIFLLDGAPPGTIPALVSHALI